MHAYGKLLLVALCCLSAGIPLWTWLFAPRAFSAGLVADPGFWIAVLAGTALCLFGFWLGRRADLGA
jgi:hypothetical protein